MKRTFTRAMILAAIGTTACLETQAAMLNFGDTLTIDTGVSSYDSYGNTTNVTSGSYFGVDTNGNRRIDGYEKTSLSQGTTGLVIGATSTPGAYHIGAPLPTDTNEVTAPDFFNVSTGSWYFTVAPTGGTEAGLDMSGWTWAWNLVPNIPLGDIAWQPGNCADLGCSGYTFTDGIGRLQWDGVDGHAYIIDFASTVPDGDPSGFGGVQLYTHLEGTVLVAVPEPTPTLLFAAALPILFGLTRRRKALRDASLA
jgi:hypothetical protein